MTFSERIDRKKPFHPTNGSFLWIFAAVQKRWASVLQSPKNLRCSLKKGTISKVNDHNLPSIVAFRGQTCRLSFRSGVIWVFPEMVVPPKHPKMIIFSRKTHGCWVPPFSETPICRHSFCQLIGSAVNVEGLDGRNIEKLLHENRASRPRFVTAMTVVFCCSTRLRCWRRGDFKGRRFFFLFSPKNAFTKPLKPWGCHEDSMVF